MAASQERTVVQRLQSLREHFDILYAHEDDSEFLEKIRTIYQMIDGWEKGALEEVDNEMLTFLEELAQEQLALDEGAYDNYDDSPIELITLYQEGVEYFQAFERWGKLEDLDRAVASWQRVVDLTPDGHPDMHNRLDNLGIALRKRFEHVGSPADLEAAISRSQKAVDLIPDGHPDKPGHLNNLGNALETRFNQHGVLADLEYAIVQKRRAVDLTPDGDPDKAIYLNNLGNVVETRFNRYGSLADLEDAILHKCRAVNLTPDNHPNKPKRLNNLGNALGKRFRRNGSLEDLEEAIMQKQKAVLLTPNSHPDKPGRLINLGNALEMRFDRRGLLADLENAIVHKQKAVELTPDGHPNKPGYLSSFGSTLKRRYQRYGTLSDLDSSILNMQKAVELMPSGQPDRTLNLINLSGALKTRFGLFGARNDLQDAISAARESAESPAASSKDRLEGAQLWARCCHLESTSALPAYACAIKLLPRLAWLGLAVDDQYYLLAEAGSAVRDAVAAAITEGEYTKAVEWAEQGRSIVWQNLLSLRTPLEDLRSRYPELAMRLQELSRCLEQPPETWDVSEGSKRSHVATSQTALAMERDELIDKIRSKPDFRRFLEPNSLEQLAPAARDGTVVFLNLGKARCDALALIQGDNGAPHVVPIPLERVTFQKAELLSKKLVNLLSSAGVRGRDTRKHKVHGVSGDKGAVFKEVLKTLWVDYVQPIIDGLAYQVDIESPPRLWWCTTGPLAFLPLHAAGVYDSKEAGHKLSDYVVSSYTPTLTALLDEPTPVSSNELRILAVAVSNTPGAPLPCTEDEVRSLQRLAPNLLVASLVNEKATQERVLREMEKSNWVHLACHGEQVGGKPMESGLILHDGKLELSKIVKARLPNADFAFLSACQTAVGDGGVPEESAHLAAGMLFAGYQGVVATMWSIQDDIAPRVTEDFYRYMFRHGQPKRAEAAYALHRTVRSLQKSGVPFTSWVPFIHIGH